MSSPMSRPQEATGIPGAGAPPPWLFVTDAARATAEYGWLHGWRLGRNIGPTAATVTGLRDRLLGLQSRYDAAVSVIGWSLGGIYARSLARDTPTAVRQVITLGSPIHLAHEGQSRAGRAFNRYAHLHVVPRELPLEPGGDALPVPATSIYSRCDGIVAWQACLDAPSPRAENIAVVSSHLGFGHHPAVIWAVADRLAQPLGQWAPFRAPRVLRSLYPPAPDYSVGTSPPSQRSATPLT
jgi:pimeloyl-ACP methyl ester carboxylesterase